MVPPMQILVWLALILRTAGLDTVKLAGGLNVLVWYTTRNWYAVPARIVPGRSTVSSVLVLVVGVRAVWLAKLSVDNSTPKGPALLKGHCVAA